MMLILLPVIVNSALLPPPANVQPVPCPHFPSRVHAFIWRNWQLVPVEVMARVLHTTPKKIIEVAHQMNLIQQPCISSEQRKRAYITIIRRNWHLLPFDQLLELLEWDEERLAYTLREDDFLFIKLGSLKPQCEPLSFEEAEKAQSDQQSWLAHILYQEFPQGVGLSESPLFSFLEEFATPTNSPNQSSISNKPDPSPRFCYSYVALYGDTLLDDTIDSYPEGLFARLSQVGVNGVWLHSVLMKLAPFPWAPEASTGYKIRLHHLNKLIDRAKRYGIGVYLYLNEPRAMPLMFFDKYPQLKGVCENDFASLCTSNPEVLAYIENAVFTVCRSVPDLAGIFTISASENLTHCWSHLKGADCPRCSTRDPGMVIAELHEAIKKGIERSGAKTQLIVWDWGWQDNWVEPIISLLPDDVFLMSVSEWALPITRGGIESTVGEYCLSVREPGPRAKHHWELAKNRGLRTIAKIQAGNTWELAAVPYIPVVANVATHVCHLRELNVDGFMLGWTLGGYPSPNLEAACEIINNPSLDVNAILKNVAARHFGEQVAPAVVAFWQKCSDAFLEFPFHIQCVYTAPFQLGPANLLWESPTGYRATMVGLPYDDVESWVGVYPPQVFVQQLEKVARGFEEAIQEIKTELCKKNLSELPSNLTSELRLAEVAAIHFQSVANQVKFTQNRNKLSNVTNPEERSLLLADIENILREEAHLAKRLYALQSKDSRIGFEATNHYFYIPMDLVEKVINCYYLLEKWLPAEKKNLSKN